MSSEKEHQLIAGALALFMRLGIKSVNMDDVARHLGVSKKTLYLYFKDKEDLIRRVIDAHCIHEQQSISAIQSKKLPAIDEMFEIMHWVLSILSKVNPSVQFDLEKYHPEQSRKMMESRHGVVYDCMLSNMKKGQKEGMYRKDFHADVIAKIYIARMDILFDPRVFPFEKYLLTDLYKEVFQYHIRGIASAKGIEQLEQLLKQKRK
jgi:AcrR family transcriptional regulator